MRGGRSSQQHDEHREKAALPLPPGIARNPGRSSRMCADPNHPATPVPMLDSAPDIAHPRRLRSERLQVRILPAALEVLTGPLPQRPASEQARVRALVDGADLALDADRTRSGAARE
jgi:hypothetical protein